MNKHLRGFFLLLPCLLLHPKSSRAITVDIPAGEVVSGGDVHSVVTQRIYGEADNFTVSGKQQVMSGGVTATAIFIRMGSRMYCRTAYHTVLLFSNMPYRMSTAGHILPVSVRMEP